MGGCYISHVCSSLFLAFLSGRNLIQWKIKLFIQDYIARNSTLEGGSLGTWLAFRNSEMKEKRELWKVLFLPLLSYKMWIRSLFYSLDEEWVNTWISSSNSGYFSTVTQFRFKEKKNLNIYPMIINSISYHVLSFLSNSAFLLRAEKDGVSLYQMSQMTWLFI